MNEQFSAFLDGEATRDEVDSVLNSLLRDSGLRQAWSHQHWLRTTLRAHSAEAALALDSGFADRVMHAITIEVSPEHTSNTPVTTLARAASARRAPRRRRWRNMASLAAVASATGIVLLVSNPMRTEDDVVASGMPATSSAVASSRRTADDSRELAATNVPSSTLSGSLGAGAAAFGDRIMSSADAGTRGGGAHAQQVADAAGSADHWSVSDPQIEDELNGYLVDHNGLARSYGLSGTTPALVRVATYGQVAAQ